MGNKTQDDYLVKKQQYPENHYKERSFEHQVFVLDSDLDENIKHHSNHNDDQ